LLSGPGFGAFALWLNQNYDHLSGLQDLDSIETPTRSSEEVSMSTVLGLVERNTYAIDMFDWWITLRTADKMLPPYRRLQFTRRGWVLPMGAQKSRAQAGRLAR
jgi:hypothetical protein